MSKKSNKKRQIAIKQKKQQRAELRHALDGMNTLSAIEKIVDMAEDSKFNEKFLQQVEPYAKLISEKQGINTIQAIFLSIFVEYDSSDRRASICDISRFLDCRCIHLMKYKDDIEGLVKAHFLRRRCRHDDTSYYVPGNVMKAITEDVKYNRESYMCEDATAFFQRFYSFTHLNYEDDLSYDLLYEEIKLLFSDNAELDFVRKIKSLNLDFEEEMILTHFCRHLVLNEHDAIPLHNLTFLLELDFERERLSRELKRGNHILMRRKLIEYNFDDGFEDKECYRLTNRTRKTILKGFNIKLSKQCNRDFILSKSIEEKKLFYEGETVSQIGELKGLLSEENFKSIKARMKAQKMRCGFACIFYGAPGTGKTETALQLARMTG